MGKLWLNELELHNIKQHADRTWQFVKAGHPVNLIGMIGRNGSGKSTILDALLFLFTGEIPQEKKEDLIGWADPNGKSYVRGKLLFDGKQLELYREAHSTGAWMKLEGLPKKITGITQVNKALEEYLGVDKDLCQKQMFVRQNDIIDILFTEPAKRKKAWQKLMGMGEAENIHIAMGNFLSGLPPVSDHIEELDNNKLRLRGIRGEMHRLRHIPTAGADYARELLLTGEITRLTQQSHEVLALRKDWSAKNYNASRLDVEVKLANGNYTVALEAQNSIDMLFKSAGDPVDDAQVELAQKDCDEMARSVKAFESVSQVAEMLEADYVNLDKAKKAAVTFSETDLCLADKEVRKLSSDSAEIASKLALNRGLLNVIEKQRIVAECPLCLQPVANADQLKTILTKRIADMGVDLAGVNKALDGNRQALQMMQTSKSGSERQVALMEQEIANLTNKKDELVSLITTSVEQSELLKLQADLQKLKTRRSMHNDYGRRAVKAEADLKAAETARNKAYDEWRIADASLSSVAAQLTALPTPEAIQAQMYPLQQELAAAEANVRAAATLAGQWKGLRQSVQATVADIRRLADKMDQEKARRDAVKVLEDVRNFFHHTQGPTMVVSRILEDITSGVNEFLGHFNAPYTVIPEFAQMSFRCIFTDGRPSPEVPPLVNVLSGGEKVALALSFRLAGYFMFSSRIGFITIDEPTNHLDETNIDNFRHLLERLKVLSQETGLQILISTHARGIISVLDYVIDLAPEKQ